MGLFSKLNGNEGESIATLYLKKKHYKILEKNYRTRNGEIDIIAKIGDTVVFVEVKKRNSDVTGRPEEYVTPLKRKKIIMCAKKYIFDNEIDDKKMRFDVISILGEEITHIVNAFDA